MINLTTKRNIFKFLLLAIIISLSPTLLFAKNYTISGYVSDKYSGERLINANVYNKSTMKGVIANNYGFYSISLPEGKVSLVASFIGYQARIAELEITSDMTINFELSSVNDELEEVVVVGNKIDKVKETQMSMIDVPIQKLQKIPVILGEADVLKVMQLLPGVQSGTEGTCGIYVRGGSADQNLFLLDGVPVYNASHLLGFFSVFNPDALKSVKLYKGGFPARFSGRLSSVVDISMKEGNMKKLEGNFSIGLISSKLSLEGPIVKDKTSFIISARRTYIDLLTKPLFAINNSQSDKKSNGGAFFHDYNMKINHIFSEKSRLYVSGYLGKDKGYVNSTNSYSEMGYYYEQDETEYGQVETAKFKDEEYLGILWGNRIASVRWNYLINPKLFSNTTLTYSRYMFDIDIKYGEENITKNTYNSDVFGYYSGIRDLSARVDFDYFPTSEHDVKFGINYSSHKFMPGVTHLKTTGYEDSDIDYQYGNDHIFANELTFYAEDNIKITPLINANVGLNLSTFFVQGVSYVRPQPRVSMRYRPRENWSLKASYSRMAQHVHLLTSSGISMPTDLWLPITKKFEPAISDQIAVGTAFNLPKDLTLTVEGYYKTMKNLLEYKEGASFMSNASKWESKVEQGKGWTYGIEFLLEKNIGKTTGWIGYTLAWNNRKFENLNFGKVFPAKYDCRHDISIAVTHEFSKKADIGVTWVYHTGNNMTLSVQEYDVCHFNEENYGEYKYYEGRNNYRLPPSHRLDIGANFHKQKKHGIRTWSVSVYNAYNYKNPFTVAWNTKCEKVESIDEDGTVHLEYVYKNYLSKLSLFPIIPTVSYSFRF